ncbi:MAG: phosphopantetheine-binding protein [Vicinamibacterales bacterium]
MTREAILAVIAKHLANAVDGLDPATVDGSRSMKDYGANSLDIVEVVSSSMRELKIKVPRSELNKLTNINGLVDLLHTTASASAPVAQ